MTEPAIKVPAPAAASAEPPGLIEKARAKVEGVFKSDEAASSTPAPVTAPAAAAEPAPMQPAAAAEPKGFLEKARAKVEGLFKSDEAATTAPVAPSTTQIMPPAATAETATPAAATAEAAAAEQTETDAYIEKARARVQKLLKLNEPEAPAAVPAIAAEPAMP